MIDRCLLIGLLVLAACDRKASPHPADNRPDTAPRLADSAQLPPGPLGASILRGEAIFAATPDSLPHQVRSALRCASCHLDNGRSLRALPLRGVYGRFPQYRSRTATVQSIEDRINDCFERSLNGKALAVDDPTMRDMVTYLAFLSHGDTIGDGGERTPRAAGRGDVDAGRSVYLRRCARCHAADGGGQGAYPPLWGPRSFTIGAGMARYRTMTAFIAANMPFDQPGTLDSADAVNVAAYVTSRARPDFPGKEHDWPEGDAPVDIPYRTIAGHRGTDSTAPH